MSRAIKKLSSEDFPDEKDQTQADWQWNVLVHNGVLFPPEYEPLPANVKVLHKGTPIDLDKTDTKNPFNVTAEEAAVFFAMKMEQDDRLAEKDPKRHKSIDDKGFVQNFWRDWKIILGKNHVVKDIKDVDFTPIQKYIARRSEAKKAVKKTAEENADEKREKKAIEDLYGYAIIDGMKIKIGQVMVQPPGLFIGHGKAPRRGKIKKRIAPSDITLNLSKKYRPPQCLNHGKPCRWGDVVENHEVTWLATWKNPITKDPVYIWLKREESHFVRNADAEKFTKAQTLNKNIAHVRRQYTRDLTSPESNTRQLATAVYLLDVLAVRPDTAKDEKKEADTRGLTTLKCDNITFEGKNEITINFIGKSSIEFLKRFEVPKTVYANLRELCRVKTKTNKIFPGIKETSLNSYLKTMVPDLTSKVFRTYKASSILQAELLKNLPKPEDPIYVKKLAYDRANLEAAKALNHKKMGGSKASEEKTEAKLADAQARLEEASTEAKKKAAQKDVEKLEAKLEELRGNISLTTSKTNYISPQITVSWCKLVEMPIEKIYTKGNVHKFGWAMTTTSDWRF